MPPRKKKTPAPKKSCNGKKCIASSNNRDNKKQKKPVKPPAIPKPAPISKRFLQNTSAPAGIVPYQVFPKSARPYDYMIPALTIPPGDALGITPVLPQQGPPGTLYDAFAREMMRNLIPNPITNPSPNPATTNPVQTPEVPRPRTIVSRPSLPPRTPQRVRPFGATGLSTPSTPQQVPAPRVARILGQGIMIGAAVNALTGQPPLDQNSAPRPTRVNRPILDDSPDDGEPPLDNSNESGGTIIQPIPQFVPQPAPQNIQPQTNNGSDGTIIQPVDQNIQLQTAGGSEGTIIQPATENTEIQLPDTRIQQQLDNMDQQIRQYVNSEFDRREQLDSLRRATYNAETNNLYQRTSRNENRIMTANERIDQENENRAALQVQLQSGFDYFRQGLQQLNNADRTTVDEIERISTQRVEDLDANEERFTAFDTRFGLIENVVENVVSTLNELRQNIIHVPPNRVPSEAPLPSDYELQLQHTQQLQTENLNLNQNYAALQQQNQQLQNQLVVAQQYNQQLQANILNPVTAPQQLPYQQATQQLPYQQPPQQLTYQPPAQQLPYQPPPQQFTAQPGPSGVSSGSKRPRIDITDHPVYREMMNQDSLNDMIQYLNGARSSGQISQSLYNELSRFLTM